MLLRLLIRGGAVIFCLKPTVLQVWYDYDFVRCGARTRNTHREDQKLVQLPHATRVGDVAQMVERSLSMREVLGSIPSFSNTCSLL